MKLSRGAKVIIGLVTAWTTAYPFLFLFVWLIMFGGLFFGSATDESALSPFFLLFSAIFPLHCLTIGLQLVLMGFYIVHIIRNTAAAETIRIILALGVFLLPFIAMPIYYYLYVWSEAPPEWALAQPAAHGPGPTH